MREHYVYIHRRASDGRPFYVGKGKQRRAWQMYGRNAYWQNVAKKHGVMVEVVKDRLPEPCALSLERALIASIPWPLANLTDGGGGTSGWNHSEETKARISARWKGRRLNERQLQALREANERRVVSDETRARLSDARKGRKFGPRSAATRAKIAASHIGIRPSAETLMKMSLAKIGKAAGRMSPTYDHSVRHWRNNDGREFIGTRADFIRQFGLRDSCVSSTISGKQKSVKGWTLV